jgi:D-amino peptidase
MKPFLLWFALFCLSSASWAASKQPLKVYISVDMEGIGGVSTWEVQATSKGREYEEYRHLMTKEVNAAINGAFEAGATDVLVSDSHGDAQNIDLEQLDPRAQLIRAWPRPLLMMQGMDSTFGAVVFVGYHAQEGRGNAVLSHTFSGDAVIKLNGQEVPEGGFNAAVAGDFGVPVVFLSGDQTICEDAKALLGPIETAAVKQAFGFHSAQMISPAASQEMIRAGVKRGVERRRELKPYKLSHPVTFEARFNEAVKAEVASFMPGVQRVSGNTISAVLPDMTAVSKLMAVLNYLKP